MGKADPSLRGKKPSNTAAVAHKISATQQPKQQRNPGHIANRLKRSEMYGKYLQQKRVKRREERLKRAKETEELGEDVTATSTPSNKPPAQRTLDNTREVEPTLVHGMDLEVMGDEADDEFAPYFVEGQVPKVLITTRPHPSQQLFYFIADLQKLIPGLHFYPRKNFSVKDICQMACDRDFTHLMVLSEKSKKCHGLIVSHLRKHDKIGSTGPTAFFKLTNVITSKDVPNHGASTSHIPELNLHGFTTRLGHRVGRLLGSLFPPNPQHLGRQVVTFHNQRDFIFVRHHRYIFDPKKKDEAANSKVKKVPPQKSEQSPSSAEAANPLPPVKTRLQELGPRFTLKLRWLQEGTFDTVFGEYEWYHKRKEMDTTRRRFHL